MDYEVHRPGHQCERQMYHINLLWEGCKPKGWVTFTEGDSEDLRPQGMAREETKARMEDQVQIREELSVS